MTTTREQRAKGATLHRVCDCSMRAHRYEEWIETGVVPEDDADYEELSAAAFCAQAIADAEERGRQTELARITSYWSHGPNGFVEHESAEEARAEAAGCLTDARDWAQLRNEWPDWTHAICYGALLEFEHAKESETDGLDGVDYALARSNAALEPTP